VHIAFVATRIFLLIFNSVARIIVNRGGTRSSKTYSIAQLFVWRLFNIPGRKMGIGRKSMPALRQSAMLDVINILKAHDLYDLVEHNKATNVITNPANGASITFVSFDETHNTQKKRGASYHDFWFNEGNECTYDNFKQVNMRLTEPVCGGIPNQIHIDFNPDDPDTWIKVELEDKGRCEVIVSSYLDNPFLSPETIAEIEWLRENDPEFWTIYGLGQYGQRIKGLIYPVWDVVQSVPSGGDTIRGLDFGFNHPMALTEVTRIGVDIYLQELVYESGLLVPELIVKMAGMDLNKKVPIYADSANPDKIEEIYRAGWNIHPSDKAVGPGIAFVKRFRLHIVGDSPNLKREIKIYKWKEDKNGNPLDEPVKFKDDGMDSIRYPIFTHGSKYWRRTADTPPALPAAAGGRSSASGGRTKKYKGY
jgi:phage terminase large subunit